MHVFSFSFVICSLDRSHFDLGNFVLDHWAHWIGSNHLLVRARLVNFFILNSVVLHWYLWLRILCSVGNNRWVSFDCSGVHWNLFILLFLKGSRLWCWCTPCCWLSSFGSICLLLRLRCCFLCSWCSGLLWSSSCLLSWLFLWVLLHFLSQLFDKIICEARLLINSKSVCLVLCSDQGKQHECTSNIFH